MNLEIKVPEFCMGDIIGDVNTRRGKVLGMEAKGHNEVIKAQVPMIEVLTYVNDLTSMTRGRGSFTMNFSHNEEVPAHLAKKIIEAHSKEKRAEG
jgi:elongation factor G